jgi:hypothetical protein
MDGRESEIDGLIDEHRQLITLLGHVRRALDEPGADLGLQLDRLEQALARHTDREETGLFRVLGEADVGPEYVGLFEHDHGHLVDLIAVARHDRSSVGGLVASFEAHMLREENDMFPAAEQLLGPADWEVVEIAVAHLR